MRFGPAEFCHRREVKRYLQSSGSLFHPDGWKRLEIKSIAVPWMHTLQFGREKCSLTTSAGKNCIFPYRETSKVKLWLWIPNSNDALLGCPGITIIYYQSFVSMAKASPAKSVVRNSAGKNAVWAYRISYHTFRWRSFVPTVPCPNSG